MTRVGAVVLALFAVAALLGLLRMILQWSRLSDDHQRAALVLGVPAQVALVAIVVALPIVLWAVSVPAAAERQPWPVIVASLAAVSIGIPALWGARPALSVATELAGDFKAVLFGSLAIALPLTVAALLTAARGLPAGRLGDQPRPASASGACLLAGSAAFLLAWTGARGLAEAVQALFVHLGPAVEHPLGVVLQIMVVLVFGSALAVCVLMAWRGRLLPLVITSVLTALAVGVLWLNGGLNDIVAGDAGNMLTMLVAALTGGAIIAGSMPESRAWGWPEPDAGSTPAED